jgi:hypothetical protein
VSNRAAQTASMETTGAPKCGNTSDYTDAAARSGAATAAAPTRCMQRLKALLFILLLGAAAVGAAVAYLTGASCAREPAQQRPRCLNLRCSLPAARPRAARRVTGRHRTRRRAPLAAAPARSRPGVAASSARARGDALLRAGHNAELQAFHLQFEASAEQLHADLQAKLSIQAKSAIMGKLLRIQKSAVACCALRCAARAARCLRAVCTR